MPHAAHLARGSLYLEPPNIHSCSSHQTVGEKHLFNEQAASIPQEVNYEAHSYQSYVARRPMPIGSF